MIWKRDGEKTTSHSCRVKSKAKNPRRPWKVQHKEKHISVGWRKGQPRKIHISVILTHNEKYYRRVTAQKVCAYWAKVCTGENHVLSRAGKIKRSNTVNISSLLHFSSKILLELVSLIHFYESVLMTCLRHSKTCTLCFKLYTLQRILEKCIMVSTKNIIILIV